MKKPPSTIYRYRTFNETTISALCADKLYFSRPEAFNDPLDCKPTIGSDSDLQSLRDLLRTMVYQRAAKQMSASLKAAKLVGSEADLHSKKHANLAADEALANLAYHATNPEYKGSCEENEAWLITQELEREILHHYDRGVCCFSATDLDPLLWSHYGDCHRGLCIGYTLERNPKPVLHQAVYGGRRTIKTSTMLKAFIQNDSKAKQLLNKDVLLRKANCWKYENEWRLIGAPGLQDSTLKLCSITFGLRCSSEIRHTVTKALERRTDALQFFEAKTVRSRFILRRDRLCLEELRAYLPHTSISPVEIFGDMCLN